MGTSPRPTHQQAPWPPRPAFAKQPRLRPAANARRSLRAGGASWRLLSWPFSKRPHVSEAEAPADDGDVASELCNRPERVVASTPAAWLLLGRSSHHVGSRGRSCHDSYRTKGVTTPALAPVHAQTRMQVRPRGRRPSRISPVARPAAPSVVGRPRPIGSEPWFPATAGPLQTQIALVARPASLGLTGNRAARPGLRGGCRTNRSITWCINWSVG
jgi:hypothetical protein